MLFPCDPIPAALQQARTRAYASAALVWEEKKILLKINAFGAIT
jgi:hypothetical protein